MLVVFSCFGCYCTSVYALAEAPTFLLLGEHQSAITGHTATHALAELATLLGRYIAVTISHY